MKCADVEARVDAYLDGELDAEASSALRGHLRACAACRTMAEDHARVAGALASLAPAEPPPALWAAVQRGMADAEAADAEKSTWSLGGARLWRRLRPHLLPGLAVATAAVLAVLVIESRRDERPAQATFTPPAPDVEPEAAPDPAPSPLMHLPEAPRVDIDVALAQERARIDALYAATVDELIEIAGEERAGWPAAHQRAFDAQIAGLRAEAEAATGVERDRAWQALVKVLQRAALGERVLAGVKP